MRFSQHDRDVVQTIARLVREGDGPTLDLFVTLLETEPAHALSELRTRRPPSADPHTLALLEELVRSGSSSSFDAVALAGMMRAALKVLAMNRGLVQDSALVWTGPEVHESALRSTPAVLAEMIDSASAQIVLATYSLRRETLDPEQALFTRLSRAMDRGAAVTLVVHQNEANLRALRANWPKTHQPPRLLTWPIPGGDEMVKLHAKIAEVDDRVVLISSANLTYHGMFSNLEMGVLLHGAIAGDVRRHFDRLERAGHLVPWE